MTEPIKKLANIEIASAKILLITTFLALIASNSFLQDFYNLIFHAKGFNLQLWINDGLMPLFFLFVGLEIKYELIEGHLNSFYKAMLPGIGALGGMLLPGLIYFGLNFHNPETLKGWAIPTATDIAFAFGVLSLLGDKIPSALKSFLLTLAILDDLFAILVIAIFYTSELSYLFLIFASICLLALILLNHFNVRYLRWYFIFGLLLWFCFLKSGIHPTLAGVILAWTIPLRSKQDNHPLANSLKHSIHPWVAFIILPLFAFANAGTPIFSLSLDTIDLNIFFGIALGLLIGKPLGITGACWIAKKLSLAKLPEAMNWSQLFAVTILCGIGFTISLFIGDLAFTHFNTHLAAVKAAVLAGSFISGIVGYLLLRR